MLILTFMESVRVGKVVFIGRLGKEDSELYDEN